MLVFEGLPNATADHYKAGGTDAYGCPPEYTVSDGDGVPCRRCLRNIPKGHGMLILAHRPFSTAQPYAETGPIFLCTAPCEPVGQDIPEVLTTSPDYLLKGYSADERIVYGTGAVVPAADIPTYAQALLDREDVAFVDVRSARNNCWQVRVTSG